MNIKRAWRHLLTTPMAARRIFPAAVCQSLEAVVSISEQTHRGEIRFVVEHALPVMEALQDRSSRDRAVQVFSELHIWDTEANTGVLVYVLLADNRVEIVADRGINARVVQAQWEAICADMVSDFRQQAFADGAERALQRIHVLLEQNFPAGDCANPDELPNQVLLR